MHWCSLHHHSTLSSLDAYGLPEQHVERCAELGIEYMALTEHGNVSSHVKLEIACDKLGGVVKPLYGCEFYIGGVGEQATQRKNHITALAMDVEGYKEILRLMTRAWAEGFYYEPTIAPEWLWDTKRVIVLSGCLGSELATHLVGGKHVEESDASYRAGLMVARTWRNAMGHRYFLEVQAFPELTKTCAVNEMIQRISRVLKIPIVATGDVHYMRRSDSFVQQILHNVRPGEKRSLEDMAQSWGYDVPLCPPYSDAQMLSRLKLTGLSHEVSVRSILASEEIAQECGGIVLPKLPLLRWPMSTSTNANSYQELLSWLREGWRYRGLDGLSPSEWRSYQQRLRRELRIIRKKDFQDYFLIVADVVQYAKNAGIFVGPARGSAAGSLVCWLLRITEVNPMLYPNLVFERFIDITREDYPDIDLDFDSNKRYMIYDYLLAKYKHVGNLGTFTYYKAKLAIDDVARVFRIPKWEAETVKELLIERSSGDLRASGTIEDTIEAFPQAKEVADRYPAIRNAVRLEGQVKNIGVHAAGIVIANGPLDDVTAIYRRKVGKLMREVVAFDKYDAERQGLIKIDVLGLSTCSMIDEIRLELGWSLDDVYNLPLDDPVVLQRFADADLTGIFQFDGRAMRSVTAALRPDSFKELCDINALARPGPLHNGASTSYIDIKRGAREPERRHPLFDAITGDTHYQIVYQEQILRIVREIGGFSWTHAAYIRKIISRKLGEQEFNRQYQTFADGAAARGVPKDVAEQIWKDCITAGSYAFNAAHSVSYGMLADWSMYFKEYYDLVFFAAALNNLPQPKHHELMKDAAAYGRKLMIKPPKPRVSRVGWSKQGRRTLRAGWSALPGVGVKTAEAIIESDPQAYEDLIHVRGIGPKTMENVKAFVKSDDPFELKALERKLDEARQIIRTMKGWLPEPTHTAAEVPYVESENNVPIVWFGTITHRNLRDLFELNRSKYGEELDPETVKDPHLNEWVIMRGHDGTELCTFSCRRWDYPRFKELIWKIKLNDDVVLIRGHKWGRLAFRYVYIHDMWLLSSDVSEGEVVEEDAA